MKRFVAIFAVLAFASIASADSPLMTLARYTEANGPRAVQFRGGGQQFRNQSFRQPALNALRFAGNLAIRGHGFGFQQGFNQFNALRFNNFHQLRGSAFRQSFYGGAFRSSYLVQPYYAQQFIQPVYVQPFAAPQQYTQRFADPCGSAAYSQQFAQPFAQEYSQPFAAYSAYSQPYGLGFNQGYGLPFRGGHGHGGHHHPRPAPVPAPVPAPGR